MKKFLKNLKPVRMIDFEPVKDTHRSRGLSPEFDKARKAVWVYNSYRALLAVVILVLVALAVFAAPAVVQHIILGVLTGMAGIAAVIATGAFIAVTFSNAKETVGHAKSYGVIDE